MPATGWRAFVQVKSKADVDDINSYIAQFRKMDQFRVMFFVVPTASPELQEHAKSEEGVNFWGLERLPNSWLIPAS